MADVVQRIVRACIDAVERINVRQKPLVSGGFDVEGWLPPLPYVCRPAPNPNHLS